MIDALLDACRAAPDDDAPRLVWADAVGGERGELVVIQCDLARGGLTRSDAIARRNRERELLAQHGAAWSGLRGLAKCCTFRRGFVDTAAIELATYLDRADEIERLAPLLSSVTARCGKRIEDRTDDTFEGPDTMAQIARFLGLTSVRTLRGLEFANATLDIYPDRESAYQSGYGDEIVALLLDTGRLRELRAFGLTNCRLTAHGLSRLAAAPQFALERLVMNESFVDWDWYDANPAPLDRIPRAAMPQLRALQVRSIQTSALIERIPPNVTELAVGMISDAALAALAHGPLAANLERLAIYGAAPDLRTLEPFPRLRSLYLFRSALTQVTELLASPPPSLCELAVSDDNAAGVPVDGILVRPRAFDALDRVTQSGDESWLDDRIVDLAGSGAR